MRSYDHKKIEKKWQKEWDKQKLYETPDAKKGADNSYLLVEFPYPSGNLHVGHWYAFAVPDILARKLRMDGKNVLYPIGFDAFGLPAENAAIKNKLNPRTWTEGNIKHMKEQIRSMGTSFDWSREVATFDPGYYRWTQWLFLRFFDKGLAYQKETAVNWCPKDKTVLANEQVVDGKCERCGAEVEQRNMLQWNLKITDYADRLIDDLEGLDWPKEIKESQKNWIGRSEGAEIDFSLEFERNQGPKPNFLILHGYTGRAGKNFIPWLKEKLEERGFEVQTPEMPNSDSPKESEQVSYVMDNCKIDENTIMVGHSLGGVVAMKVLEKINRRIGGLVLVAPAVEPAFRTGEERPFWNTFTWGYDYERIKKLTGFRVVLSDLLEKDKRGAYLKYLSDKISAPLQETTAQRSHFTESEEPFILSNLLPHLTVFTTRPDTLFGATYLVLAPEHPWVQLAIDDKHDVLSNKAEVRKYVTLAKKKTELERLADQKEKTGVKLEGVSAVNPATGEKIPLFVADYVLGHYGTGAIMAVPAHDERDYAFAKKFRLPIQQVIMPVFGAKDKRPDAVFRETINAVVRKDSGELLFLKWKEYKWLTNVIGGVEEGEMLEDAAVREVLEETGYRTKALFVSPIAIESHFYAEHKKEWRSRIDNPVLLELESDQKGPLSQEEKNKHDTYWMTYEEAIKTGLFKNNMLALDFALGKINAYAEPRHGELQKLVNSADFNGLSVDEAKKAITEKFGRKKTTYKIRDWVVSRQRYWGVPIPIIHCEKCGAVAVPDKQLPLELPEIDDYLPTGDGASPLAKVKDWVETKCPQCKGQARRETDTLDTFVDSSWYFLRYTDPGNAKEFASRKKMDNWMPVDLYSGGAEHTTMHLLYSRFWYKAMFDLGLVKDVEPYKRRMNRSLILGPDGQKMSKSKGNVIDPDEVVENLGADTVRMYLAFIGPYNEVSSYPWNPDGVVGIRRFLERLWRLSEKISDTSPKELEPLLHRTIKKIGEDIIALKFNTAISQMMIFLNAAEKSGAIGKSQWETLLKLLAPFAPHAAEELWHELGHKKSIHLEKWPQFDESQLLDESVTIAVQINGKSRTQVILVSSASETEVRKAAEEAATKWLEGREVVRVIFVPNRLINLVLA